jgi:acyl dehydratase
MQKQVTRSIEEIDIGDEIGPIVYMPTAEVVHRFAAVVRMIDRRFIDPTVAQQKGFTSPIVPGPLSANRLTQMLIDYFPGWRLRTLSLSFRSPVKHGEQLTCWGTVTEKDMPEGIPTVHCDVVAETSQGERAVVGTAILQRRMPRN